MEQMQILLAILVLLPFVSALLLALCGSDRMRRLVVYGSAGVLMISAVAFAVCFFSGENLQLRFLQSGGIIDHTMLALEAGFAVLITVLSIKYRRYYVAVLSIVQTVLTFVYELGGYKPAVQPMQKDKKPIQTDKRQDIEHEGYASNQEKRGTHALLEPLYIPLPKSDGKYRAASHT